MMAEAIHSFVDSTHELFLLLGVHQAQSPADDRFPYGQRQGRLFLGFHRRRLLHGRWFPGHPERWQHILHPDPVTASTVGYVILTAPSCWTAWPWSRREAILHVRKAMTGFMYAFRNTKDPSMRLLIFENSLDIVGESLAFCGILLAQITGILYFDGIASIIVGAMLVASALWQANQIKNLLIGQSADDYVVQGIRELVAGQSQVCGIEELTTLHMGPDYILVNLRLRFDDDAVVQDVERASNSLEEQIRDLFPIAKQVYVAAAALCWDQNQAVAYAWPILTTTVGEQATR